MNKKNQNLPLSNEMILRLQQFHSPNTTSKAANVAPQETSASFLQPKDSTPSKVGRLLSPREAANIPSPNQQSTHAITPVTPRPQTPDPRPHSTFREYLLRHARVPLRDTRSGAYGPFTFEGRAPLDFIVTLIDKILANCLHNETVEIDGITFPGAAGALGAGPACKGATLTVGGGAQFGKTVLILNFQAFATFIEFINFGYYTPDQELLAKIVDTKFRPDVIDQQPWMAEMVQFSRAENASGRAVNRKNSYQVSSAGRKSFGHFCGMQKPPTTISLDAAALDEVDDIPAQNMGYVDGRMSGSRLQLKFEIGTQRIAGAGQNARLKAGTLHVMMYECPSCHQSWNLEEEFPRCIRIRSDVAQTFQSASSRGLQTPCPSPTDSSDTSALSDVSEPEMVGRAVPSAPPHVDTQETSTPILQHENVKPNPSPNPFIQQSINPPASPANPSPSGILHQASGITPPNPILTAETPPSRTAIYYTACPNCGTELDRDSGRYIAKNPHRLAAAHFSIRVSQLNISAISLNEIVAAWYTAMADPSGAALAAFHCDRLGMPNAGAAQPITQTILDTCRTLGLTENENSPQPYDMKYAPSIPQPTLPSNASEPKTVGRAVLSPPPHVETLETSANPLQPEPAKPSKSSPEGEDLGEGELPLSAAANIPNPQSEISNPQSSPFSGPQYVLPQFPLAKFPWIRNTNGAIPHINRPGYAIPEHEKAALKARHIQNTIHGPHSASFASSAPLRLTRYAGLDTGPRCWLWVDEWRSPATTACVWAELIASGIAPARIPQLMRDLNITCLFIDAGGEPDLTKRLVLTLNGLDHYTPPNKPRTEILHSHLGNIGRGLTWDGAKARWTNLRAAAVLFVSGEAKGIEQTIGFTQDGKIYPLIKCNRRESIQTAVNDFLTPENGVYEMTSVAASRQSAANTIRTLPRARLPQTYRGTGVSQSLLDSHLLNLRQERDLTTGEADWIDGVENHLGLAKVYARLAATLANVTRPRPPVAFASVKTPWSDAGASNLLGVESHSRPYLGL